MIKAVIFDLAGVLVTSEWTPIYKTLAAEIQSTEERAEEIVQPLYRKWRENKITPEGFWEEFTKQAGVQPSDSFIRGFWIRMYQQWSQDIPETWEIARELAGKGIRLALLTNIIEPSVVANEEMGRFQRLREIGFEALVHSYEVGCGKPCRKMYETVLNKLNLSAEHCVYTDDKEKNVAAANELGMQGILFESPQKLREVLVELGLLTLDV